MEHLHLTPIYAGLVAMAAMLAGGLISHRLAHFLSRHSAAVIAFSAGAMLSICFGHALPESFSLLPGMTAGWLILLGVLIFYVLESFLDVHVCHGSVDCGADHGKRQLGQVFSFGLAFHSFFDGLIIFFAFAATPALGWLTTLGIALHKLPVGAILHSVICQNKQKSWKNFWPVIGVSAMTLAGTAFAVPFADLLRPEWIGAGLAISTGSLLYITLSDMIPQVYHHKKNSSVAFLIIGIAVVGSIALLSGGGHGHDHSHGGHGHHHDHGAHDHHGHS